MIPKTSIHNFWSIINKVHTKIKNIHLKYPNQASLLEIQVK